MTQLCACYYINKAQIKLNNEFICADVCIKCTRVFYPQSPELKEYDNDNPNETT